MKLEMIDVEYVDLGVLVLPKAIYRDKKGNFKPVRFSSYIWKRIDGFILDSLKKELERERRHTYPDWERYNHEKVIESDIW